MSSKRDIWKAIGVRFLITLPFFAGSAILFGHLSFLNIFIAAGLLMPPAFILAPPVAELFGMRMSSFYYPEEKRQAPRLMFSLAEACIMKGRHAEAMDHYREMHSTDPARVQVSIRMIDLALRHLNAPEQACDAYHEGMAQADTQEKRTWLSEEYGRLMTLYRAGEFRG